MTGLLCILNFLKKAHLMLPGNHLMALIMVQRKRRSQTEWKTLLNQHKESELNVEQFCDRHDLCTKTFYKYRREVSAAENTPATPRFIKAKKTILSHSVSTDSIYILHYQGCHLQIKSNSDADWVAQLMKALT